MPSQGIPAPWCSSRIQPGDVVEEVAVVGDGDDRALELGEVPLEPPHALGVEMVRGLVEEQHVGLGEEQPAERHAAPLAARDLRHVGVARGEAERVHREVDLVVELPEAERVDPLLEVALLLEEPGHLLVVHRLGELRADLLELPEHAALLRDRLLDVAPHVLRRVELGLLRQVADLGAGERPGVAGEIVVHARHDAEQGRLAGAVRAEHADLGTGVEREVDALENFPRGRNDLPKVADREDVFAGHRAAKIGARAAILHRAAGVGRARQLQFTGRRGEHGGLRFVVVSCPWIRMLGH